MSNRWKMGVEWVAEPLGIIVAEDSGVVRWVDLNPFNRTARMSHNSNITCAAARTDWTLLSYHYHCFYGSALSVLHVTMHFQMACSAHHT